jgi:branched-chain amino acid transport system ATP-binding protein
MSRDSKRSAAASDVQEVRHPAGDRRSGQVSLRATNVAAGYGRRQVLRDVNLECEAGTMTALCGINGAGKSTLLKVLAGILAPTTGAVLFEGCDITAIASYARSRAGIGYLGQRDVTFDDLTVRENLLVCASSNGGSLDLPEFAELLDPIRQRMKVRAGLLSGGLKRLLGLALVLSLGPRVLLLDEPTAGLHPELAVRVLNELKRRTEAEMSTIIVVEQNVRGVLAVADRAMALRNGSVVAETDAPSKWLESNSVLLEVIS